ncbi:ketopantoate reductase family protein [Pseudescherichia sp.]|uniref:ketopantoate reductase family protein n=1 Tax=Pseudescherichia sp. TaxID=2055881 RepID=UPI00289B0E8F|nr:ketopantoate reductase family protein [Pseudescherichia sp.]
MSDLPKIALIGPGAIGTTIAAALHEVGRTPLLCGRTAHLQLTLRHEEGEIVVPGPVLSDPAAISHPFDVVFVAVKVTQVADCASWLATLCDENTIVCALQNGVEQQTQLAPLVNGARVLPSIVWFPAQRESDASVWLSDSVPQEIVDGFHRAPADLGTSILADRQANRPLEWDIRNGVIQRYGQSHGVPTPISDVLVPLLAAGSEGPG